MRRFVSLAVLVFFTVPFGISVTGCGHKGVAAVYCNAGDSGPQVGQVASITLSPTLATVGESLNYGQIGQSLSTSALDCKGNTVAISKPVYATSNMSFADINPSTGQVCGGTWNRNSGGGIPDYNTCTAPAVTPVTMATVNLTTPSTSTAVTPSSTALVLSQATDSVSGNISLGLNAGPLHSITVANGTTLTQLASQINTDGTFKPEGISAVYNANTGNVLTINGPLGLNQNLVFTNTALVDTGVAYLAYVTATASGAVSNAIPIYIHPVVTGIVLGGATASCNAGALADQGTDCCPAPTSGVPIVAPVYTGQSCLSQNAVGQLIARVYANGTTNPIDNITCRVGHLTFAAQSASNVVSIDQNGIATADQPGSTIITTTVSNSSSATAAGFFATCPPASIALALPSYPAGTNSINVSVNNLTPLTATVTDTKGQPITGLSLTYESTAPQIIPAAAGSVTPTYPGTATITAACLPGACNPSPFSQIGLYGNGKSVTSNGITVTAAGTVGTLIYMGSKSSQYLMPKDFTVTTGDSLVKLPYPPGSMVISQDGSVIYIGSPQGLMTVGSASGTVTGPNQNVPGTVLSVSPDGTTVVVTDPIRQTISLYSTTSAAVTTSYGGVGTHAAWTPDSQTVYITTTNNVLLTHSSFVNWQVTPLGGTDTVYTDVAVMVPSIGAYFAGAATEGRSYCPTTTLSGTGTPQNAANVFAPLSDEEAVATDRITATTDGKHILGAHAATGGVSTLSDLAVTLPVGGTQPNGPQACTTATAGAAFTSGIFTRPLSSIVATAINGVVSATNSSLAFVTYAGTSGQLPVYVPSAGGAGTLSYVPLLTSGAGSAALPAIAPISGVFSTDNLSFYAGTSDGQVHLISITGSAAKDTGVLTPALPPTTGNTVAPIDFVVQAPKKTKS